MEKNMNLARFAALALAVPLTGCTAATTAPTLMQPVVQPMSFQEPAPTYSNPGSLFNEQEAQYLFSDSRARRVGDIVTVKVVESSTGTNTANTTAKRDSSTELTVSSLFGRTAMPVAGGLIGSEPLFATETSRDFQGDGTTTRRNTITATVAARVINVMPDGLLQIEGARETKVNNETQYLVVSGLIRSRDVSADNSVLSTQIADAQIAYYGKGVVSDRQRPGWFSRLLDNVWPF
jgi:flagellar L-ring protein precursor FlgH